MAVSRSPMMMRVHGVERVIGALLKAEIVAKQARSVNYQMRVAKLPVAKELASLDVKDTPITGALLEDKRNIVLIGGTGTGKTHIGIRHCAQRHPQGVQGAFL